MNVRSVISFGSLGSNIQEGGKEGKEYLEKSEE